VPYPNKTQQSTLYFTTQIIIVNCLCDISHGNSIYIQKAMQMTENCHSEQREESLFRIPRNFNSSTRFFGKASE